MPATFEQALDYTMVNNYDVLAAKQALAAREYTVKANYGSLLPQIAATGEVAQVKTIPNTAG